MSRRPSGLVQQGYFHPVWIGVGQEESFPKVCRGRQRALMIEPMEQKQKEDLVYGSIRYNCTIQNIAISDSVF